MNNLKNKIIKNTIASAIENFFGFAIPFLLFPFTINHLGVEISGVWLLCSAITGYFGILEQGPGPAVVKYIAEFYATRNFVKVNKFLSSGFVIFILFGFVVMMIMLIVAFWGQIFFKLGNISPILFRNVFILMGVTLMIVFPLRIFNSILRGLQEFNVLTIISIVVTCLRAISILLFLSIGKGIYVLLIINSLALFLQFFIPVVVIALKYPAIKLRLLFVEVFYLKSIMKFGGITFLINLCAIFMFQTDRILLGSFLSISAVTYYSACKQIYDVCRFFPVVILQAIMPFASELDSLQKEAAKRKLLFFSTKYSYAIFIPLGTFVMFFAKDILSIWVGREYALYAIYLQILVFHLFFNFLHQAGTQILVGMNKIKFILFYFILTLTFNLVLSILLIKKYQMLGVALGTTIPFVLFEFIFIKRMTSVFNITIKAFLKEAIFPNLSMLIVSLSILTFLKAYFQVSNILELIFVGSVTVFTSLTIFWIFGLGREEKRSFLKIVRMIPVTANY